MKLVLFYAIVFLLNTNVLLAEDRQIIQKGKDTIILEGNKITIIGHPTEEKRKESEKLKLGKLQNIAAQKPAEDSKTMEMSAEKSRQDWASLGMTQDEVEKQAAERGIIRYSKYNDYDSYGASGWIGWAWIHEYRYKTKYYVWIKKVYFRDGLDRKLRVYRSTDTYSSVGS